MTSFKIMSDREPTNDEVLVRLDYYAGEQREGGMLCAARDATGGWYEADGPKELRLPSGTQYSVPRGETPALFFSFRLLPTREWPFSDDPDKWQEDFTIDIWDAAGAPVALTGVESALKHIACWGAWELREDGRAGKVSNHFWGEMFVAKEQALEALLQRYRKPSQAE